MKTIISFLFKETDCAHQYEQCHETSNKQFCINHILTIFSLKKLYYIISHVMPCASFQE